MNKSNIQTENIIETKRTRAETERLLPSKRQFGKLKALPFRYPSAPLTEKMSKRWKKYYQQFDVEDSIAPTYVDLLNKSDITMINSEDKRIKSPMSKDDDSTQYDSILPIFQRILNVGKSATKKSLITKKDLNKITKKFNNDETKYYLKGHQKTIDYSIQESHLYRKHGVVGMCVRNNSYYVQAIDHEGDLFESKVENDWVTSNFLPEILKYVQGEEFLVISKI